jgi:cytochrome P450
MGTKFAKQAHLYSCFATDLSVFSLTDLHEATQRRNLIGPFFSRRAIMQLENVVQSQVSLQYTYNIHLHLWNQVDNLVSRLLTYQALAKPANLEFAFRTTSLEVITSYCFGVKPEPRDCKDFQNDVLLAMNATLPMIWIFKYFPRIKEFMLKVPEWMAAYLKPGTIGILEQRQQMGAQIDELLRNPSTLEQIEHETIYHHLLTPQPDNQRLPPISRTWLLDEGLYLRFAGSDTVGNVCTVGTYHVLSDSRVQATLVKELEAVWPDRDITVGYETLEKLPFLVCPIHPVSVSGTNVYFQTAVIKESLRMAHGVVTPLPRVVGPMAAEISGEVIPAGVSFFLVFSICVSKTRSRP